MIANLAEELYTNSIQLKKYNSRKLLFKKNRLVLEKELYQIHSQVNEIIIPVRTRLANPALSSFTWPTK